jgi:hypothetical protein
MEDAFNDRQSSRLEAGFLIYYLLSKIALS